MSAAPRDPAWESKVRASFARQRMMATLGARLAAVRPGEVVIELPFSEALVQQHGFLHAGATTAIADSAGGYASLSLMPPGASILTIELKVNLLAPAAGELFRATGRVVKAGRRVFVTELEVVALDGEGERTCLVGMQSNLCLAAGEGDTGAPPG